MMREAFLESLSEDAPPEMSSLLLSLWWDKKGNWDNAHRIAQDISSVDGSRVHAYLHRVEGDKWNANYWYNRAEMPYSSLTIEEEWENLVDEFLKK